MITVEDFYGILALNAVKDPIDLVDEDVFYDQLLFKRKKRPSSRLRQLMKDRKARHIETIC